MIDLSQLDIDGPKMNPSMPRYRTLSSWLKGIFGEPVRKITIDAGLGCPNRDAARGLNGCIYCNNRGSGTGAITKGRSIAEQVDQGIGFLSQRYGTKKFIGYFQSFTNTNGPTNQLRKIYEEALARPEVVGLAIGTRPDCVPNDTLRMITELAESRLVWMEYGLQSVHERTLKLIKRGHSPSAFFDAVDRTHDTGLPVVVHLILGLPGETLDDMIATAKALAKAPVQGVKLHPLYVVHGTELEKLYRNGEYTPLSQQDAADATMAVLRVLPPDVVAHRLTSDPHPNELVAPLWMLDRRKVRIDLLRTMEATDFRQGSLFGEN